MHELIVEIQIAVVNTTCPNMGFIYAVGIPCFSGVKTIKDIAVSVRAFRHNTIYDAAFAPQWLHHAEIKLSGFRHGSSRAVK